MYLDGFGDLYARDMFTPLDEGSGLKKRRCEHHHLPAMYTVTSCIHETSLRIHSTSHFDCHLRVVYLICTLEGASKPLCFTSPFAYKSI